MISLLSRLVAALLVALGAAAFAFWAYPRLDPVEAGPGALFVVRARPIEVISPQQYEYRAVLTFRLPLPDKVDHLSFRPSDSKLKLIEVSASAIMETRRRPGTAEKEGVVLLFDNSISMLDNDPAYNRLVAARNLLGRLGPQDEVTVACFPPRQGSNVSGPLDVIVERVPPQTALAGIEALRKAENQTTPLYDAMDRLLERISSYPRRPTVLVLADGDDNWSQNHNGEGIGRNYEKAGIPVYAIGLGHDITMDRLKLLSPSNTIGVANSAALSDTFAKVGGTLEQVETAESIRVRVRRLGRPFKVGERILLTFRKGSNWRRLEAPVAEVEP